MAPKTAFCSVIVRPSSESLGSVKAQAFLTEIGDKTIVTIFCNVECIFRDKDDLKGWFPDSSNQTTKSVGGGSTVIKLVFDGLNDGDSLRDPTALRSLLERGMQQMCTFLARIVNQDYPAAHAALH